MRAEDVRIDPELLQPFLTQLAQRFAGVEEPDDPTHAGVAVQAADTGRILMIQRKLDQDDDPEVRGTWEFPGGGIEEGDGSPEAAAWREFAEETGLATPPGETTGGWRSPDGVYQGFVFTTPVEAEAFEHGINPPVEHRVIPDPDNPECREPDVQAWFTREQIVEMGPAIRPEVQQSTDWTQFLETPKDGAEMPDNDQTTPPEVSESVIGLGDQARQMLAQLPPKRSEGEDEEPPRVDQDKGQEREDVVDSPDDEDKRSRPFTDTAVPWHGVLAPEGVRTGDGRRFLENSLDHRPLPLPLTWQKTAVGGHDGNVTIAKIEKIKMVDVVGPDGETVRCQVGAGHFVQNTEAEELIGLIGEFGRFGVSIDADDTAFDLNEDEDCVDFSYARSSAACVVSIPAFHQAWVSLGEPPEDWGLYDDDEQVEVEALVAAGAEVPSAADIFNLEALEALAKTEDGPGWLTHPVDTDRLRDYWVRGEGAAKIGWGSPGDFNRCRALLAQYVKPQHLSGYCANRHYDALGIWPGQHAGQTERWAYKELEATSDEPAEALSLVAGGGRKAPAAWFADPRFEIGDGRLIEFEEGRYGCPLTVTEEGQVFGHAAAWDVCHIGFKDYCQTAPHSMSDYGWFRTGGVLLDDGTTAATGVLSIGGGHAAERVSVQQALAHYDSTSTAVADVTAGEDEYGIWVAGWIRPGVTDDMVTALRASAISGDWREIPLGTGQLELVAALAVNVPGFGIPRTKVGVRHGSQRSLVAAGVVPPADGVVEKFKAEIDVPALAYSIALEVERILALRAKVAEQTARFEERERV